MSLFLVGSASAQDKVFSLRHYDITQAQKFIEWVNEFNVEIHDNKHFGHIFTNWLNNDNFIEVTNYKNLSYTVGHNSFSGYNLEEFASIMGFRNKDNTYLRGLENVVAPLDDDLSALPKAVDWRGSGVTPVKDQGQCGSCWSFSTTGALESAYYNKFGKLISFSEQQLVDCDNIKNGGRGDRGCNGGLMDNAFTFIGKYGGLCTEDAYPYVSGVTMTEGTCQKSCQLISGSKIASFVDVKPDSDDAMMSALVKQTVSVAIEADSMDFQLYKSGVFTGKCGTN
jgi:hypothetical protein